MSAKVAALAFAAMALVPGRAVADPIIDVSVVRSIEQTAQGTRISLDVDRPAVEQYIRTAAMSNLQSYPGVKIDKIAVGGAAGSPVFDITAELTIVKPLGIAVLRATGTLAAHLALSIGGGNMVEGQLFLDSISLGGGTLPLNGVAVGAGRRQVDLSGVDGVIQRIAIESIDASWIAVSIDVTGTAAAANSSASVQVEVAVPLEDVRAALETAIPQKIERLGATEFHGNVGVRYGAWRGPISVVGVGNALRVGMRIEFVAWGCLQIQKPWGGSFCQPIASCGYGNDPHPVVEVWVNVTGTWTAGWSVAASATLESKTIWPCNVTFVNYDATHLAIDELRTKLQQEASKMRDRLQLRPAVDRAWSQVAPLPLGKDTWLVWSPSAIRAQPIQFQASEITSEATLTLDASVVTSATPPARPAFPSLTLDTAL